MSVQQNDVLQKIKLQYLDVRKEKVAIFSLPHYDYNQISKYSCISECFDRSSVFPVIQS